MKKIKITNEDKIIFPKERIKKIDIINYYIEIADIMLPYIQNRLLSVVRCHKGINNECFIKKHPTNDKKYLNIFIDKKEEYFYINKDYQIIYQVQNGTLEFHIWASTINKINKPDLMIFDLDPDEKVSIDKLREAVLKVKSVLDELKLESFLKTSGGKGYHIIVPFKNTKNWDTFYNFAKQVALIIENKWPNEFTTNLKKDKRKGKIFIDYLRNNRGATCVAPYSLRTRDKATISMPISWESLNHIYPNEININNYKKYLNNSWDKFFEIKQELK